MKKIIPLLFMLLFAVACQDPKPEPTPEPTPTPTPTPVPNPTPKNSFKAIFTANPSTFSAQGGDGVVEGTLQEFSPEGKMISEKQLKKEQFTIALKAGDATQITIDDAAKTFKVAAGKTEALFTLEAKVTVPENLTQELTIKRDKEKEVKPNGKTPLEYVAEYNMNPEGTAFVTTHATDVSGYFTFEEACTKFKDITINGKKYHLPSKDEWLALFPMYAETDYVNFGVYVTFNDISETTMVNGESVTSTNDYRGNAKGTAYALRFKGTKWLSAWKYEYTKVDGFQVLKITTRPVGSSVTVEDIMKPDFWESDAEKDVVRIFPASGFMSYGSLSDRDALGRFWSSTVYDSIRGWFVNFNLSAARVRRNDSNYGFTIRLFETPNVQ